MIVERVFTPGLAQVAYLVADQEAGEVAVIDPRRDVDAYVAWAADRDIRIVAILETHVHADFVTGAPELAARTGAPIHASRLGNLDVPHHPMDDGDEIEVGSLTLRALWTPGHTPEHMSFLLIDPAQGNEPVALFSGDVLFVGEVGRPDLLGKDETQRLAGQLFHTVTDRLMRLDDETIVYPGHTAGSSCGKRIGDAPSTTIGQERLANYAFQARSKQRFIDMVLDGMPVPPTYYPTLKRVNKEGATPLTHVHRGEPLTSDQLVAHQANRALVVDTRSPAAFGEGHIPGAFFAGLGTNFVAWMGWMAPYERDLILILEHDEQFAEAVTELQRIGLDRTLGYLAGGMTTWRNEGREVVTLPQISVQELATRDDLTVLDVRNDDEWKGGHIPEAHHQFAGKIVQCAEIPVGDTATAPVAVICGSGFRSSVASSVLQAAGYRNLINVTGGMAAWNEANLPITSGER